jgi:serine/threonine protein kinase
MLRVGKYELVKRLGGGACGCVYQGRDPDSGNLVAIKVLKPEMAQHEQLLRRFNQEFAATRTLVSPYIVQALEFGQENGLPYIVMEFVDGKDLWSHITARGKLPEAEAVAIGRQIALGLHHAHEQAVIHRDVKPENILLLADGRAKLTDFGLVKDLDAEVSLTETSTVLGTPNFMAPEQFENPKGVDRRCDLYALAATLYMAVTGEVPFYSKGLISTMQKKLKGDLPPPRKYAPDLSECAEQALLRALSVKRDRRQADCLEFIEDLTGKKDGQVADASAESGARAPAARGRKAPTGEDRRKASRFSCDLDGACRPVGASRRTRWKARVTDVSAEGLGLLLSRRFDPGTVLLLELRGARLETVSQLLLRVVRVQKAQRQWAVGCQLACRLKPAELQDLTAATSGGTAVPFWLVPDSDPRTELVARR